MYGGKGATVLTQSSQASLIRETRSTKLKGSTFVIGLTGLQHSNTFQKSIHRKHSSSNTMYQFTCKTIFENDFPFFVRMLLKQFARWFLSPDHQNKEKFSCYRLNFHFSWYINPPVTFFFYEESIPHLLSWAHPLFNILVFGETYMKITEIHVPDWSAWQNWDHKKIQISHPPELSV